MNLQLEPADIFLTRRRGFGSWAIRFFTRHIGEPRTEVSHVGVVVEGGSLEKAWMVEARGRVRHRLLFRHYGRKRKIDVAIFRPLHLTPAERAVIVETALRYVGKEYSYFKILLHLADWLLQGAYVFRRLGGINDYPICSWLVAQAYAKAGETFGVPPGAASPDDIWDYVTAHPKKYQMLHPLAPLVPPKQGR
jgi:hypothetical protein